MVGTKAGFGQRSVYETTKQNQGKDRSGSGHWTVECTTLSGSARQCLGGGRRVATGNPFTGV